MKTRVRKWYHMFSHRKLLKQFRATLQHRKTLEFVNFQIVNRAGSNITLLAVPRVHGQVHEAFFLLRAEPVHASLRTLEVPDCTTHGKKNPRLGPMNASRSPAPLPLLRPSKKQKNNLENAAKRRFIRKNRLRSSRERALQNLATWSCKKVLI